MCLMDGFSRVTPAVLMAVFYGVSFSCLTLALKRIDVSVAYAIWSGVGVALICGIGVFFFREPFTPLKALGTLAIVAGVVALNAAGTR